MLSFIKITQENVEPQNIVYILDASDSAANYRQNMIDKIKEWDRHLPVYLKKRIFFLSYEREYSDDWQNLNMEITKHANRGSFIGPVFRALEHLEKKDGLISRIILLRAGKVYDLEDWQQSKWLDNLLIINFGGRSCESVPSNIPEFKAEEGLPPILQFQIDGVEISGEGFMPIQWDNRNYQFFFERGKAALRAADTGNHAVVVGYLGAKPEVKIRRGSLVEALSPGELKATEAPFQVFSQEWKPLTEPEERVFLTCLKQDSFTCPHCKNTHSRDTVICERSGILGRPVYDSLSGHHGFVVFCHKNNRIHYQTIPFPIVALDKDCVAVQTDDHGAIYKYAKSINKWLFFEPLENYRKFSLFWLILL